MGATILTGFVFGRLLSLGLEGVPSATALGTLALETTGLIASIAALALRFSRDRPSEG
jgi:hypothetical protein